LTQFTVKSRFGEYPRYWSVKTDMRLVAWILVSRYR
jgi:hypothetical protein